MVENSGNKHQHTNPHINKVHTYPHNQKDETVMKKLNEMNEAWIEL